MSGNLRRGFSLLEAIVGVAIAAAFLSAIAVFLVNLGDTRTRLARISREIESAEVVFSSLSRACATAVVDGGGAGTGIAGNETSLRIVRSAVSLGNDGGAPFDDLALISVSFDSGSGRMALSRGSGVNMLAAPVRAMRIRYLDERGWQDAFDSRDSGGFPVGIEVSIWFARGDDADVADEDAPDPTVAPPDRTRFFRVTGGPQVDALAIRRIDKERSP